jgi:serine/threonine protein kinase
VVRRLDGVAKVLDFGIAHTALRAGRTATGLVKGKLAYMAPEQARGDRLDQRADQFALGILLWEMLTQRRLYKADDELG